MTTATDGVTIFVDGHQFWSSRATLVKAPYFAALFGMNEKQTVLHLDRNVDLFRHVLSALRGYPCYVPIAFQERVNLIQEMMHFQLMDFIPAIISTFDPHEKVVYDSLCEPDDSKTEGDDAQQKHRREFSLSCKTKTATTAQIIKQRRLW